MPSLTGTINGSIKSVALNVPCNIRWLSIWNRSAGVATVNLGIVVSGRDIYFKALSIAIGGSSNEEVDIRLLAGAQILVSTNQSIDYTFTLE